MFLFKRPWKRPETSGFLIFSKGIETEDRPEIESIINYCIIIITPFRMTNQNTTTFIESNVHACLFTTFMK